MIHNHIKLTIIIFALIVRTIQVKGGLPGVDWGELYAQQIENIQTNQLPDDESDPHLGGSDLEFCCFVTHDKTGCSCAVYRSLEKKLIAVSFRGTCELVDLVTDASIIQEAWVEGEDIEAEDAVKVHVGFRYDRLYFFVFLIQF